MKCTQPGCPGTVLDDGYCDTCGSKARAQPKPFFVGSSGNMPHEPTKNQGVEGRCTQPGCTGTIAADGYCDTCGLKATAAPAARTAAEAAELSPLTGSVARSLVTGSARSQGSRRTTSARTRSSSRRSAIGAGIVDVPDAPVTDPSTIVMANPEVAEDKRFCAKCGSPVGRRKGDSPGRLQGFCGRCRQPFDFIPKLQPAEMIGGQYQVVGCLAHGGLGWIYLAQDRAVNDRWVVIKGLLNAGDEAAMAAAVAEKRFLAEVQHPSIVQIFNFVTHKGAGYIVMEYVGGPSLKNILKQRREANGNQPDPLPVPQALAYMLAILPAFTYMHERGLVYCDFKPDNLIQVGDEVRLIDMGGVRRLDDPSGDIYGTVGFQAPEIATMGPSVASDLYTVGRTLAVLTLDFRGYQSTFEHSLPDPAEHPPLARFSSFYRLLLKATAPHPDDRFQSATELADQILGVLREVVAVTEGQPQPGPSTVFAGVPADGSLPLLATDAADPAAPTLTALPANDPAAALQAIDDALEAGQITDSIEVKLRRARALLDLNSHAAALALCDQIEADDPWEWRAVWLRGASALATGDLPTAAAAFDRCQAEVPGELAPKLAAAIVAEGAKNTAAAAALYDIVSTVDPSYVGAASGLARCRLAVGDVTGALQAYGRVPTTHRAYGDAQVDAARALISKARFAEASSVLDKLGLDALKAARLDVELFEASLASVAGNVVPADPAAKVRGRPLQERSLRQGLEDAYRRLATLTPDDVERFELVDRANRVRPLTVV